MIQHSKNQCQSPKLFVPTPNPSTSIRLRVTHLKDPQLKTCITHLHDTQIFASLSFKSRFNCWCFNDGWELNYHIAFKREPKKKKSSPNAIKLRWSQSVRWAFVVLWNVIIKNHLDDGSFALWRICEKLFLILFPCAHHKLLLLLPSMEMCELIFIHDPRTYS